MAGRFCMSCGNALAADAAFCFKCGAATGGTPGTPLPSGGAAPTGPGPLPIPTSPATPVPPSEGGASSDLASVLGLAGRRSFVVQHEMLSLGHSYRVMDAEKRHLFTVEGSAGQNLGAGMLGGLAGGSDSYLGRMVARSGERTYQLKDPHGELRGVITKQAGANRSVFTLADGSGRELVRVQMERSLLGGLTATALAPDGAPLLVTSGNLLRHNFEIRHSAGGTAAKVHEAWVAVRDTYSLDLEGDTDPLYPLVFAVLIDFEKVK